MVLDSRFGCSANNISETFAGFIVSCRNWLWATRPQKAHLMRLLKDLTVVHVP